MAIIKKFSAVKKIQKHLLGIQNLSIQEANLILDEAKNFFNTEKVFSDTLSSKKLILDYLKTNKLENISNFIFSHPMAGTENFGIMYSKHDLFLNSTSIICPMENSNSEFIEIIKSMWSYAGCNIFEMDPYSVKVFVNLICLQNITF